jgi:hypothetical protein
VLESAVPLAAADLPPIMDGCPFMRDDARAVGLRPETLPRLVSEGVVRHVVRGVYIDNRVPDDLASRAACLRLRLPPGAVVSRLTAAWLWGVDGRMPEEREGPVVVECTVPRGVQPIRRPGVRGYAAPLGDDDVCLVAGIPTTTSERTSIDALRWLRPHMSLAVADALAAMGLVSPDAVVTRLGDFAASPGIRQARYLAGLIDPLTESFGESWLRLRIVDAGFPRPRAQIEVLDAMGRCVMRLDLGWEDRRIAVEYDGEEHHSTAAQLAHDRRRREVLERTYGWRILAVGKGEVLGQSLELEKAVGELLGLEPRLRRRRW